MSIVVLTEKSSQIDPYAKALGTPKPTPRLPKN